LTSTPPPDRQQRLNGGGSACAAACMRVPSVSQNARQCQAGSEGACYRAAAALCQCNLSMGGCGYDLQPLQQCVAQNLEHAASAAGR
jgi:hypothetical protein